MGGVVSKPSMGGRQPGEHAGPPLPVVEAGEEDDGVDAEVGKDGRAGQAVDGLVLDEAAVHEDELRDRELLRVEDPIFGHGVGLIGDNRARTDMAGSLPIPE